MSKRKLIAIGFWALLASAVATVACAWIYRMATSVAVVEKPAGVDPQRSPLGPVAPAPDDWPWWRGSDADGISTTATPPLNWSSTEQVEWSTPIPGRGHSSPIVWGSDVYLTTADEAASTQSLLNVDLTSGDIRWTKEIHSGQRPVKHEKNSHASATPACDGTHIYTAFASDDAIWVTAVDPAGDIVWQTEAGPFESFRGYGSSLAVYGSTVIVLAENRGARLGRIRATSFLAALDRASGDIVWRVRRPERHSYGSPIVRRVAGRDQLLFIGAGEVHAYEPSTGESLWFCRTTPDRGANSVATSEELVFASGSNPQAELVCVRADGNGDVTSSHILWTARKGVSDVPSPLYHDGLLYSLGDNGILTVFEASSGDVSWKKRLGGNFTASPIIAAGHLYAIDEEGKTTVLTTGPGGEVVATSELHEPAFATPTPTGSRLLIRTQNTLWCLSHD